MKIRSVFLRRTILKDAIAVSFWLTLFLLLFFAELLEFLFHLLFNRWALLPLLCAFAGCTIGGIEGGGSGLLLGLILDGLIYGSSRLDALRQRKWDGWRARTSAPIPEKK
jgi:hypothetical protein